MCLWRESGSGQPAWVDRLPLQGWAAAGMCLRCACQLPLRGGSSSAVQSCMSRCACGGPGTCPCFPCSSCQDGDAHDQAVDGLSCLSAGRTQSCRATAHLGFVLWQAVQGMAGGVCSPADLMQIHMKHRRWTDAAALACKSLQSWTSQASSALHSELRPTHLSGLSDRMLHGALPACEQPVFV